MLECVHWGLSYRFDTSTYTFVDLKIKSTILLIVGLVRPILRFVKPISHELCACIYRSVSIYMSMGVSLSRT
jgi:hypothetical protein